MRNKINFLRACFAIGMAVAMLLSTMIVFTGEAVAETIVESEPIMDERPPIPPYTIWGTIFDENNIPVSDAMITITNLRTYETLNAESYENGFYEVTLDDLPSGYEVEDKIDIEITANSQSIIRNHIVEYIGFGERVDIHFGDSENNAKSETSSASNTLNNPVEQTMLNNYEPSPSLNSEPVENSEPIIIDTITTTSTAEPIAEITLVDMRAPPYFRLAFTEKENELRFSLINDGDEKEIIIVDLYHVEPDGITETFLKTVHFGMLLPGKEKFRNVFEDEEGWIPTETGRNWIRGEIYVQEKGNERTLVNDFRESFNVVPGWRPVMHIEGDWIIDEPTIIDNRTIVVDGDVYVNAPSVMSNGTLIAADFIISDAETITATFDVDLECSADGEFKTEVKPGATLNIYGLLWNTPHQNHYWFYNNGTLNINGQYGGYEGTIENTHGSPDLSQPGGIICTTDNVLIENGATIKNSKTHGIWLENSDAVIRDSFIHDNGGDGIVCLDGSAPSIEGNTVEWNGKYGINANNSLPIIKNANTIQYNRLDGIFVENVISAEGKPDYTPGTDLGYFIWYDETGWHVRMSSNADEHVFNGTVISNGDETTFTRTVAGGGESTLDIGVYAKVVFDIYIDGVKQPDLTFIGPGGMNPSSIPFTLAEGVTVAGNTIKDNFASGLHLLDTNIPITDNTISSNGLDPVFEDDFEIDSGNWTADGLWHRVNSSDPSAPSWNLSHSGDWSYWYGQDATGNYSTGSRTFGNLTSINFDTRNATTTALTFWSWYETDTLGNATDQRWVHIQSSNLNASYQFEGETMGEWTRYIINISAFAGKRSINVTFSFDTINDENNTFQGWYIDDVEIVAAYPIIEGHGIYFENTGICYVSSNTIDSNNWDGINGNNISQTAIDNNTISGNRRHGIVLDSSSTNNITNNTISNNTNGIWLTVSKDNVITDNIISYNQEGIILHDVSNRSIIENNTVSNTGNRGLEAINCSILQIGWNNFSFNRFRGVDIRDANPVIVENMFNKNSNSANCGYIPQIQLTACGGIVKDNVIIGSTSTTTDYSSNTIMGTEPEPELDYLQTGILATDSTTTIELNVIINHIKTGMYLNNYSGIVISNEIDKATTGIHVIGGNPTIVSNTISNHSVGVSMSNSSEETDFYGNIIEYCDWGFRSVLSSPQIVNNTISSNENDGIHINNKGDYSLRPSIKNNTINGNHRGIYILNATVGSRDHCVDNKTVYGPSVGGEMGPIFLINGNIVDCSLYVDLEGEWIPMVEGPDYTLDYLTGEIDITPIAPMDAGWTFYAFYNYSEGISNNTIFENAYGIYLSNNSKDNIIINSTISENIYGIYSVSSSGSISNNTIENNIEAGIYCDQSSLIIRDNPSISNNGHGIWAKNSNPHIENVTVQYNKIHGIFAQDSNPSIKNATIQYNKRGGIYLDNSNAEINRCNIRLNEYEGIKSVGDSNQIISYNDVWGNFLQGISITGGNATVEDNLIYNNRLGGMEVKDSPYYLSIHNNNITGNRWVFMDNSHILGSAGLGIGLVNTSANISSNRICGNLENIRLEGLVDTYISNNLLIQYVLPGAITPAVYRGVQATDSANLNISDNRFYVISEPISIYDCKDVTIFNNTIKADGTETYTFRGVEYEETFFEMGAQRGIYSERSGLIILENYIANCTHGIKGLDSTLTIKNNTINGNGRGIYILNAPGEEYYVENETVRGPTFDGETGPIYLANGNIIDCSMYANVAGEWIPMQEGADYTLDYATGTIDTTPIEPFEAGWFFHAYYNYTKGTSNIIINNIINDNTEAGIYLEDSSNNEIIGNSVSDNLYGFWLEDSLGNTITGNTVTANTDYGIYVNGDSSNNWLHHNSFYNNNGGGVQAFDSDGNNYWDEGTVNTGNYWDDWLSGTYPIDGGAGAVDNYPLSSPP